jgi:hypothetical protein
MKWSYLKEVPVMDKGKKKPTLKVSQPEAEARLATTSVPPPFSAERYFCRFVDMN